MRLEYAVVYERTPNNYCAYAPDVPGCASTADTWDLIQKNISEALAFHIESLIEEGTPIPEPAMSVSDAMMFHAQLTRNDSEPPAELPTTVSLAQVDLPKSLATRAS
ncbi:MAG: type II toxin-antitoxin system HicB family antitoxin [bacterium]|nr:type II toxin-antitoxin system HicB family antitoxin [bacterium]MDE0668829.1 type II toxin-antitoxin system HicB family antitoxin [bacterium]MXZ31129.1 hypothetical protein [Acidimicrobiia bacterium]